MTSPSPAAGEISVDGDTGNADREPHVPSATDNLCGRVPIYSHGFGVRVRVALTEDEVTRLLDGRDWSPTRSPRSWRTWTRRDGATYSLVRGSVWLTGRKPRDQRRTLARLNRTWGTHLYAIAIQRGGGRTRIDLAGVRHTDVRRFVEDVLGVPAGEWAVEHYRQIERYIVLTAGDAARLGEALGRAPCSGQGRLSRKRYFVEALDVPVTVKARTPMKATLSVYRIAGGATGLCRCEVRLVGRRRDRRNFGEADIQRLDDVLLGLVVDHGLSPVGKPQRWEPRNLGSSMQQGPFSEPERVLPQAAWRGWRIPAAVQALVQKCHTPGRVKLLASGWKQTAIGRDPEVRSASPTLSLASSNKATWKVESSVPWASTIYRREDQPGASPPASRPSPRFFPGGGWKALADELQRLPRGSLSEVILDADQDPAPLLKAMASVNSNLAIAAYAAEHPVGPSTWHSVHELMADYPVDREVETIVIVVDVSVEGAIYRAAVAGHTRTWNVVPGPLATRWNEEWGLEPLLVKATAAWLWPMFERARATCEEGGINIVFVTVDARSAHGRGPLQKAHLFRDGRVRSRVGDAGRYWCHQRYRVEMGRVSEAASVRAAHLLGVAAPHPCRVVVVKDEAEGLVGRLVYDNGRAAA